MISLSGGKNQSDENLTFRYIKIILSFGVSLTRLPRPKGEILKLHSKQMNEKTYYVYLLTNWNNKVMYVGMTNDLQRRIYEHKEKSVKGFTKNIT